MEKRVIGITGGVGAGKSTVLACLKEDFGADIFQADELAKRIMAPGGAAYGEILEVFGRDILLKDGSLDRKKLGELIFGDDEKRIRLNSLVHGRVREMAERLIRESEAPLVAYEAALPGEAFLRELCQEIWFVYVPGEERIRRLMRDRGYSRSKAESILRSQLSDDDFAAYADRVIDNGGSPGETRRQISEILSGTGH